MSTRADHNCCPHRCLEPMHFAMYRSQVLCANMFPIFIFVLKSIVPIRGCFTASKVTSYECLFICPNEDLLSEFQLFFKSVPTFISVFFFLVLNFPGKEQSILFLHLVLQRCLIYLSCIIVTVLSACDLHTAADFRSWTDSLQSHSEQWLPFSLSAEWLHR